MQVLQIKIFDKLIAFCRTISLDELMQGLSISGFLFRKEDIVNIFNYVDVDQSGALDFAEAN